MIESPWPSPPVEVSKNVPAPIKLVELSENVVLSPSERLTASFQTEPERKPPSTHPAGPIEPSVLVMCVKACNPLASNVSGRARQS